MSEFIYTKKILFNKNQEKKMDNDTFKSAKDFIKNWYHKKIPNYGLMGYSINTETTSSAIFCTSKYLDSSLRPKLTIIYKNNKD